MLSLEGAAIHMSSVEYLIGSEKVQSSPLRIFDDEVCAFLNDFSATLLKSKVSRVYPDISALAFWCRGSSIRNMKEKNYKGEVRLGRGLCFHISPSNIPLNFAFSYLFALLSGNANIVRLPSRKFDQIEIVCDIIRTILTQYANIERRTAIIRYPANNEITKKFCEIADVRMIWGGDKTVAEIRTLPTKPRTVDLCFPDRYSLCIIDSKAVENLDESQLKALVSGFYNDTYLMDQNACSSPQIIFWKNDTSFGRKRFWSALFKQASEKYQLQEAVVVDKYTKLCEEAASLDCIKSAHKMENLVYRIEIDSLSPDIVDNRGRGGYFYEFSMSSYEDLQACVTDQFQTITYFGIDPDDLRSYIATKELPGIDRIVPVGKALDIGVIWDGYDLVRQMSRIISLS